ncbi:MAG: 30S ribosomal protein S8 [Chloroflexi bacterium]|nr:30S ribosomal protein S8 [Chloroflexota bacterium]
MINDPIADMLTRIRNALLAGHATVAIPHSKMKVAIAKILVDEGYVEEMAVSGEAPFEAITIKLKYWGKRRERRPVISNLQRVSKPGRRIYVGKDEIPWVLSGMGIAILTTPQGVMTGQQARRQGLGGEVLCYIW